MEEVPLRSVTSPAGGSANGGQPHAGGAAGNQCLATRRAASIVKQHFWKCVLDKDRYLFEYTSANFVILWESDYYFRSIVVRTNCFCGYKIRVLNFVEIEKMFNEINRASHSRSTFLLLS